MKNSFIYLNLQNITTKNNNLYYFQSKLQIRDKNIKLMERMDGNIYSKEYSKKKVFKERGNARNSAKLSSDT